MIEQHREIVESDMSDKRKISRLYEICEHLTNVYDEATDSHKDFLFIQSLLRRMKKKGFCLKVDQAGDDFKATFWRPDGDGVETFSHTDTDFVEAIERAGTSAGSQEILKMIREGCKTNSVELVD